MENLDPSVGQAFETLARIFQLEKLTVVRVYFSSGYKFLLSSMLSFSWPAFFNQKLIACSCR